MGGGAPSSLEMWGGCLLPGEYRVLWHWVPTKDSSKEPNSPLHPPFPAPWGRGPGSQCQDQANTAHSPGLPWSRVQGGIWGCSGSGRRVTPRVPLPGLGSRMGLLALALATWLGLGLASASEEAANSSRICQEAPAWTINGSSPMEGAAGQVTVVALLKAS